MSVLAAIRPDSVSIALFLHVLGAMVLVGGLVTSGTALALGWRDAGAAALRFGYRALLFIAMPGWVVMRIGAQWTEAEEDLPEEVEEQAWLGIGYITADLGGILLLVALITGGIGVRRLRDGRGAGLLKVSTVIALLLIAVYLVAVWGMSGKPS